MTNYQEGNNPSPEPGHSPPPGGYQDAGSYQGGGTQYQGGPDYQGGPSDTSQFQGGQQQWSQPQYQGQYQGHQGAQGHHGSQGLQGMLHGGGDKAKKIRSTFKTTEFWTLVVVAIALLIAAAATDQGPDNQGFSAHDAWKYVTWLAMAYIISRGLTKFGGHERDDHDHRGRDRD